VALCLIAFAVYQVSGQLPQAQKIVFTSPLPYRVDPYGCSRGARWPECQRYVMGAALPYGIDPRGCTRPGGVAATSSDKYYCDIWYANLAQQGVTFDRNGNVVMSRPGVYNPTNPVVANPAVTYPSNRPVVYPSNQPVTYPVNRPNTPSVPTTYVPISPGSYNQAETLSPIQDVLTATATAKTAEAAVSPAIQTAATTTGQAIFTSFEQLKDESRTALTASNPQDPAKAQDIIRRVNSTVNRGMDSVNNALSSSQINPEGSLEAAKNAASITLQEVERTLRENNVPDEIASRIVENTKAQLDAAIDTGVATITTATAANVAAKEAVKVTTDAKIKEIAKEADTQIALSLGNVNTQIATVVPNEKTQNEINDMLIACRNDIATNLATIKSNPSAAAAPSRVTVDTTLNAIATKLRNENVPEEVINQIIEPNKTAVTNIINEAEYKVNTCKYQAATVDVRV